ncbi:glycoside hydrolase family 2 [Sphingobacterium puteale]|uniref:Glycoside hydrolase family 2 n=1 Tax=Sphingobacterium puteale TaxID=2420510 RepID=A0A420W4U3_9SPHI|nr:sugar-binding domain-containing protein [Sphingobacterium puteale]RKO73615.1 glycoside hydrolase family 2 [Sphingobacterium puteale]
MHRYLILLLALLQSYSVLAFGGHQLNLAGQWSVQLDPEDVGVKNGWTNRSFTTAIKLPGTTDDAGLGTANSLTPALTKPQLSHLTRKHRYVGAAWYSKELFIPKGWVGKEMILKLERIIWESNVWVDGVEIPQKQRSLVGSHEFDLSSLLKAGKKHRLTIRIDNRKKLAISVDDMAHAYTDHTQIMWNGIIGSMCIEALDRVHIKQVSTFPVLTAKRVDLRVVLSNRTQGNTGSTLRVRAKFKGDSEYLPTIEKEVLLAPGDSTIQLSYDLGAKIRSWSEFSPNLYDVEVVCQSGEGVNVMSTSFGMRELSREGTVMKINGQPLFLRGTLECSIFPLTGHPPMDKAGWKKVFLTAKEWGLNHLRFHSWCPPEAAFAVADEMGFYLQVELPIWENNAGKDDAVLRFLYEEADKMIRQYGNHPSFCFWSMGNELSGDFDALNALVKNLKEKDKRHLYTATSFTFQQAHGIVGEPFDDFLITQWTAKGWVRGQGVFNSEPPVFNKNYSASLDGVSIPVVTHEIGQYAVYPNLEEIKKYTGVLKPLNFIAVAEDLKRKGLLHKAKAYTMSSGKLVAILYKEELERALKTPGISGYQLLDLHDFPGQGTALVGLLDAFWDSKNILSAAEFRQFCAPIVPLLQFSKAVYTNDEVFEGILDISNYGAAALSDQLVEWSMKDGTKTVAKGLFQTVVGQGYNGNVGRFEVPLQAIQQAKKLTVHINLKGTSYENHWNIWMYPKENQIDFADVSYTRELDEALRLLQAGKKVLLNPDWKKITGIEGKFVPVFWSPVHFPKQAGTMGLLCDPKHAVFADFPTEEHTDWQWWDLQIKSTTMLMDQIKGGETLVEMIDNFANNRKLASLFEGTVGNGKLMVASFDLATDLDQRPVAKQMLQSILTYMNSSRFAPKVIENPEVLRKVLQYREPQEKAAPVAIY